VTSRKRTKASTNPQLGGQARAGDHRASKSPWSHAAAFCGLVLVTVILYWPDTHLGFFHLDDPIYVVNNSLIQRISADNVACILTEPYFCNYSPMHLLSYMIDWCIGRGSPVAFHVASNIWAGITAGFVYLLALQLTGGRMAALCAGLLFVVHPAHVEAIVWISSRKDLVAAALAVPAIICYLRYRSPGRRGTRWYIASLALFLPAVAGKQSVIIVPGVLFLIDWLAEQRGFVKSLPDKLPFIAIGALFALGTYGAQPETRHPRELYVIGHSAIKSLWLLTGLGQYVLFRLRPSGQEAALGTWAARVVPFALVALPFLLKRWLPGKAAALICWILLALAPPMVLSLAHPVSDRYLYFPSVPLVILPGLAFARFADRWARTGRIVALVAAGCIAVVWVFKTVIYLNEWNDPRSVWYAATEKSEAPAVREYLGTHYLDTADNLATIISDHAAGQNRAAELARRLWHEDPRLETLLGEWSRGNSNGPVGKDFKRELRELAWNQLEEAARRQGGRTSPGLFYRRGRMCLDRNEFDRAEAEFQQALAEARQFTYDRYRREVEVLSQHALALIDYRHQRYEQALEHIREAEQVQQQANVAWIPGLPDYRTRLEQLIGQQVREESERRTAVQQ